MKYISDNGIVFENEQDCLAYENEIKEKKAKEVEEQKKREAEIKSLQDKINKCVKEQNDYQQQLNKLLGNQTITFKPITPFRTSIDEVLNDIYNGFCTSGEWNQR